MMRYDSLLEESSGLCIYHDLRVEQQGYGKSAIPLQEKLKNSGSPPSLSDTKFWHSGAISCTFSRTQNLLLHQKDVSLNLVFFLTSHRATCTWEIYSEQLTLVAFDEFHNPLSLPAGLGNLPLHAEKDGWHSVLGSWNGTTEDQEIANLNEGDPENDFDIPIVPVNLGRNARPGPILIFCQHHKCSGNRLAIPPHPPCTRCIILTCIVLYPPTAVLIPALQANLPARLPIAPGLVPSRQSKPSTDTTELSTSMTVWIVPLKGACTLQIGGSSVLTTSLLTC